MESVINRYVRLFLKPLDNLKFEIPMKDVFYQNQLKTKITEFGFPAEPIMKIIQDTPDTFITGSFLLHYLTSPTDWEAGDIDIFTTDPYLHKKLEPHMKAFTKARYGVDNVARNDRERYEGGLITYIEDLYEWESKSDSSRKFQIILIQPEYMTDEVIDNFDLDMIKVKFDGFKITMSDKTMTSILTKQTRICSSYISMLKFARVLERKIKYEKRGYVVTIPLYVSVIKPHYTLSLSLKYRQTHHHAIDNMYDFKSQHMLTLRSSKDHKTYDPTDDVKMI